jgi:hypothetical protein
MGAADYPQVTPSCYAGVMQEEVLEWRATPLDQGITRTPIVVAPDASRDEPATGAPAMSPALSSRGACIEWLPKRIRSMMGTRRGR